MRGGNFFFLLLVSRSLLKKIGIRPDVLQADKIGRLLTLDDFVDSDEVPDASLVNVNLDSLSTIFNDEAFAKVQSMGEKPALFLQMILWVKPKRNFTTAMQCSHSLRSPQINCSRSFQYILGTRQF